MKIPVETVVEEQIFLTRVETRYIEDGERTRSSGAVPKGDNEAKERMLEAQLAGKTPTEKWDRAEKDRDMLSRATSSVVERRLKDR